MKRYMLASYQIDSRPMHLREPLAHWDEPARTAALARREQTLLDLEADYGARNITEKAENFKDVGPFPQSILSYHNSFLIQVRSAFVFASYYPALTGAASLGERLLNHLVIKLHPHFTKSRTYKRAKRVACAGGDDSWTALLDILTDWEVLLPAATFSNSEYPAVADQFDALHKLRNKSVHYHGGEIESDIRGAALKAIELVQSIILRQFGFFAYQPWFMRNTPGAQFIAKDFEQHAFVVEYYLPNCLYVGPHHRIEPSALGGVVFDDYPYEEVDISDDQFRELWLVARR